MVPTTVSIKGGVLTLTVNITDGIKKAAVSKSGKVMLITHAGGILEGFDEPVKFGLNVYTDK